MVCLAQLANSIKYKYVVKGISVLFACHVLCACDLARRFHSVHCKGNEYGSLSISEVTSDVLSPCVERIKAKKINYRETCPNGHLYKTWVCSSTAALPVQDYLNPVLRWSK